LSVSGCGSCKDDRPSPGANAVVDADTMGQAPRDGAVVNQTSIPTAHVLSVVNPFDAAPYEGATGSIEGTVTVAGEPRPATGLDFSQCPVAEVMNGELFRVGAAHGLADAIVAVQAFPTQFIPEKAEVKTVRILGCAFDVRTVTLTFGQRLDVKNEGDLM